MGRGNIQQKKIVSKFPKRRGFIGAALVIHIDVHLAHLGGEVGWTDGEDEKSW